MEQTLQGQDLRVGMKVAYNAPDPEDPNQVVRRQNTLAMVREIGGGLGFRLVFTNGDIAVLEPKEFALVVDDETPQAPEA